MRFEEVERIAARGESVTVEFKETTGELRQAVETICAFLNTQGGQVFLGIAPSGKLIGQQVSDRTQQEIANAIRKLEPPLPVDTAYVEVPGTDRYVIGVTQLTIR